MLDVITIWKYAHDDDPVIRKAAAHYPNTPTWLLELLASDDDEAVSSEAVKMIKKRQPNTSEPDSISPSNI